VVESLSARRIAYAVAALIVPLGGRTVAFHESLDEPWLQAFYRTIVATSLTGLDTVRQNDFSRLVSIVLVLAGLTIFAYVATVLVERMPGACSPARSPSGGGAGRSRG
jgi:Ion channel